jgi:pimeloyl-ACP methyl ester carboxylesterase
VVRLTTLVALLLLAFPAATAQATTPGAAVGTPSTATPAIGAFYEPPSPLPPDPPGTLLRSAPLAAPDGVRARRILYLSTTREGMPVAVSGTVFAPDRQVPPGGFTLIAMGHNTTGIARGCAPSLDPFRLLPGAEEAFYQQQVAGFVESGFVVVATDYQGLGAADGVHPFLVGEPAAYNVLDAARAARSLPDLTLAPDTILWGHSQAGHAAAWAAQLAPTYAPDVPIAGIILAAPAADPTLLLAAAAREQTEPSPLTGYIVSLVDAWSHVYPAVASTPALTPAALAKIDLVTRECIPTVAAAYGDRPLSEYVDVAALEAAPWASLLGHNAAGRQRIDIPVLVVQGTADPLVPVAVTEALVGQLCRLGTDVQLRRYPDVAHGAVIAVAMPDMLAWARDRMEGRLTPSSCDITVESDVGSG